MKIQRYTVTPSGLQLSAHGEVVLWTDHQETVAWLLRMKDGVQRHVYSTYQAYLSLWRDAKTAGGTRHG